MRGRNAYPEFAGTEMLIEPDGRRVPAGPVLWAELEHLRRYTLRRRKEREAARQRRRGLRLPRELIA